MPAVVSRQFYVAEAVNSATGFCAPIAVATWAFVSDDVDRRLQSNLAQSIRLRPDEWKCGDIGWIIDMVGDTRGIDVSVECLKAGPFKDRDAKLAVLNATGVASLTSLRALASSIAHQEAAQ